jgi:hypothetical protein
MSSDQGSGKAAATASIPDIRDIVSDLPDAFWRMYELDSLDSVGRITLAGRWNWRENPRAILRVTSADKSSSSFRALPQEIGIWRVYASQ